MKALLFIGLVGLACTNPARPDHSTSPVVKPEVAASASGVQQQKEWAGMCACPGEVRLEEIAPPERARRLAACMESYIESDEARAWFTNLATIDPQARAESLREEIGKIGIESCELLGVWETPAVLYLRTRDRDCR